MIDDSFSLEPVRRDPPPETFWVRDWLHKDGALTAIHVRASLPFGKFVMVDDNGRRLIVDESQIGESAW